MTRAVSSRTDPLSSLHSRRARVWFLLFSGVLAGLTVQATVPGWHWLPPDSLPAATVLLVFLAAFACELMDSSLGMGYGTTLTPILLLTGFEPLQIVPAVLLSELVTGLAASLMHHRDGNVDFLRDTRARRTVLWLTALSAIGALAAVFVALSISRFWFGLAITGIILAMGVLILATLRHRIPYRAGSIVAVGAVAAFNKGLSGGGYGPLVTAGQVVSGLPAKNAVAITALAESFTCLVGLGGYLAVGKGVDLALAVPLVLGATLSVPVATLVVRRLPEGRVRAAVGIATLALGLVALVKLLG
jgi:hypothetical protein